MDHGGRLVTALVTSADEYVGKLGPCPVPGRWWADVEPVLAAIRAQLDVPVVVLRLLGVDGWRSDGGLPVVMDFADSHVGHPVLDGLRPPDFLPASTAAQASRTWVETWSACVRGSRPARALRIGEPLGHVAYAVRYQEFLDNIEPSEQRYHHGDPAAEIRAALACTQRLPQ